ncbi:hypothetical protein [Salinarimonas ramus]|nr:hypothetical protein [Salinarimonas ramus]
MTRDETPALPTMQPSLTLSPDRSGGLAYRVGVWLPTGCHRLVAPPALVLDGDGTPVLSLRVEVDPGPCTQAFVERVAEGVLPGVAWDASAFAVEVLGEDGARLWRLEGRWTQ